MKAPPIMLVCPPAERVRVRVRLCGAFREAVAEGALAVDVPRGTTVAAFREHLKAALARARPGWRGSDLVDASVLASASEILPESYALGHAPEPVTIAVLPPVCGG
jgi:molybdopterin converting factor small subunit